MILDASTREGIKEIWVELVDYPNYAVSNYGRILNTHTDIFKKPALNQQGIPMVNFSINQQQYVRSVALLVARTFLDDVERPEHFDMPIHLDGDRTNAHVHNLVWRPRWFGIKYHQQFNPEERALRPGFTRPVMIVETEEEFPTSWPAAIKYGLLDREILVATINRTVVFPLNFRFVTLED